ncbi:tetratricopeptide repeat protein [Streptomyces sp. L7]
MQLTIGCRWLPGLPKPRPFTDRQQALAWLDEERASLVEAVGWAREERFTAYAVWLSQCLAVYLDWRRLYDDLIAVMSPVREATRHYGDSLSEAIASDSLGVALRETGRTREAIASHTRAVDLFQAVGDRHNEGTSSNNLGIALRQAGRTREANRVPQQRT